MCVHTQRSGHAHALDCAPQSATQNMPIQHTRPHTCTRTGTLLDNPLLPATQIGAAAAAVTKTTAAGHGNQRFAMHRTRGPPLHRPSTDLHPALHCLAGTQAACSAQDNQDTIKNKRQTLLQSVAKAWQCAASATSALHSSHLLHVLPMRQGQELLSSPASHRLFNSWQPRRSVQVNKQRTREDQPQVRARPF